MKHFWQWLHDLKRAKNIKTKTGEPETRAGRLSTEACSPQTEWLWASVREVDGALENLLKALQKIK